MSSSKRKSWIGRDDIETLQSLDLAYHNVDPEVGLYYGLVESGAMQTLVSEDEIEAARCRHQPTHARALRGLIVEKFGAQIKAISWGGVLLSEDGHYDSAARLPEGEHDYAALCAQMRRAQLKLRDVAINSCAKSLNWLSSDS